MNVLDFTSPTPAENLACDEALLDWREENDGDEILRFWESPEPFVVAGYSNKIATEVNTAVCEAQNIPIFRRCTGGGTVLQGRGCLNYALVLRIAEESPLANISSANKFIMERNRGAVESEVRSRKLEASSKVCSHTDLALVVGRSPTIAFRKFSGNSQRRHKRFLLFHGTFLLDFDLALIGDFLHLPSREPAYRARRGHRDFLMNLGLPAADVKLAMQRAWKADAPLEDAPLERIAKLARDKYATREWNWRV